MRAAAEQAGCDTVLALAEVKETWDVLPSDSDRWDDYDYYKDDEDDGYRSPSDGPQRLSAQ